MAHTVIQNKDARIIAQCATGKHLRKIAETRFSVAADRSTVIMADAIRNEDSVKGLMVAPCNGKVIGIYANGSPYVDMATSGTVYVQVYKNTSTALVQNSGLLVGEATLGTTITTDTATEATLTLTSANLSFVTGDHLYAKMTVSDHVVDATGYITVEAEWLATDTI